MLAIKPWNAYKLRKSGLTTRNNVAYWTGEAGDTRGALELFTALLPDRQRVLGPDHPDVQATQAWIEQLTSNLRGGE